jgi:hypothetical protein
MTKWTLDSKTGLFIPVPGAKSKRPRRRRRYRNTDDRRQLNHDADARDARPPGFTREARQLWDHDRRELDESLTCRLGRAVAANRASLRAGDGRSIFS